VYCLSTEPDVEPHVDGVNALLIAVDGGYEAIVRLLLGPAGMILYMWKEV
jgi:hypothetical protein